jgi:hypothetical protein
MMFVPVQAVLFFLRLLRARSTPRDTSLVVVVCIPLWLAGLMPPLLLASLLAPLSPDILSPVWIISDWSSPACELRHTSRPVHDAPLLSCASCREGLTEGWIHEAQSPQNIKS